MVHMPSSFAFDFWLHASNEVELSCLMPTGMLIPINVNKYATLYEIKEELFEEAAKFPMHWTLQDASAYVFFCINSMAATEELLDETRRLCDVKPFQGVLKIIERKGDKSEKMLNAHISHLIALHEFDLLKNPEVNYFRWKMKTLTDDLNRATQSKEWLDLLCSQYPPRIDPSTSLTQSLNSKMGSGNLIVYIKVKKVESSFSFDVSHKITPHHLMTLVLHKKAISHLLKGERASELVFKVKGQEEYLVGDIPLIKFKYIQESLERDIPPTLIIIHANSIPVNMGNNDECVEEEKRVRTSSTLTLRKKGKLISSWNINDAFAFQVNAICRLNCDATRSVEVCIQAGLFHGGKALCEPQKTSAQPVSKEGKCMWNEDLQFDIKVCNIPRMARLCFCVCEVAKTKGHHSRKLKDNKQELFIEPLGWVNTTVYDFKNQLKTGAMTHYMWTYAEDTQTEDLLHSLGTVVSNTDVDQAAALTITFHKFHSEHTVMYPTLEKVLEYSKENDASAPRLPSSRSTLEHIKSLVGRDPLHEMHEQEKKDLWAHRYILLKEESSLLPQLLDCVEWNDHNEVSEAMALLSKWPLLPPERALELLDYAYADQAVRSYAVKCLSKVSDEELSLFLLQLVQALKHECYLHCDLVEFLLRRAINNRKTGHYLFWHLRSEMHVASVWVRFGLMLEAYCRGSTDHMKSLTKQVELVAKLKSIAESVKTKRDKEKARSFLQFTLGEEHISECFAGIQNPIDPSYRFKSIRVNRSRVMDSKMRPLWLVLENDDIYGDDIYIIFKSGDDLRQDMLALQMIRIMDRLWKNEGLDLRMNPYGCISTDNKVGLIEVVLNAETIANIQKEKGMISVTSPFKKGSLLAWLKDHNPTEASLNKAIEEFTYSCAGYCVATYVLGVADRHSDNIMVKRTGQLFHIDFGHILGHFKEKFGFRRERVPFVLTHDFVHVINKGQTQAKKEQMRMEFQIFRKHCEQAFLILRRHGSLILSLFAMMISTGLPELCCESDLNYLRETLVLDLSEDDAVAHFRSKFDEALGNSWKTSLNWASHNMVKNNKQ